jgi:WD40 repeat protein
MESNTNFNTYNNKRTDNNKYVEFHSKTSNNYSIKKTYNINEITNQQDNSILSVKINPHFQNEFALINSNFDLNYLSLNDDGAFNIGSYREHKERVNDICFFKSNSSNFDKAFVSGGNDGSIKIWDSRSPNSVKTLKTNGIQVYCLDTSEDKLVAGFGREIGIWDLKMMKNLCRYKAGHCMDVVDIKLKGNNLLTSGEDCIINHFNIENGLNMDSIVSTINLGQPASSIDFIDSNMNLTHACTSVYTMEICSFEKGSSQYSYNSIDDLYNTQYCLESFLVENNYNLRNGDNKGKLNSSFENLYNGNNYLQLISGNNL